MVSAKMLSKKELILAACLVLFTMFTALGCKDTVVNFSDFIEKPSAIRTTDRIEINLGFTKASGNWIKPVIRFEDEAIVIGGTLTFKEQKNMVSVQLPKPRSDYRVYWIDEDETRHEIQVTKGP